MLVALTFLAKFILGFAISSYFVAQNRQVWPWVLRCFLAIPTGLGMSSILFFAWLATGLSHAIYIWLEMVLALVLVVILYRRGNLLPETWPTLQWNWLNGIFSLALFGSIATGVIFFGAFSVKFPHGFFEDAWFIWNMTARFLYRSPDWTWMFRAHTSLWHPDYPLLLTLNIVQGWIMNNGDTTKVPVFVAGLFTFSIPGILFAALMILRDFKQAALATFLLLTTPWFILHGTEQIADVPVSAYMLSAIVLLTLYLKYLDLRLGVYAGFLAGLAAWTKNEGVLFVLAALLICGLISWLNDKKNRVWAGFLLGSAPPIIAVTLFKLFLAPANDLFRDNADTLIKLTDVTRYQMIFTEFGKYISQFGGWPLSIFWVLIAYTVIVGFAPQDRKKSFLIALLPLAQLFGYFCIYLITPRDLYWHLTTSLGRLLTQVFPLSLFALLLVLNSPTTAFSTEK